MPFLSALSVEEISDTAHDGRGEWELTAPLTYESPGLGKTFIVPEGFQTDFASVPRIPVAFLLAGDTASRPAALHDWLYAAHPVTRGQADFLLREASLSEGVPAWRAYLMWVGVRLNGWLFWGPGG